MPCLSSGADFLENLQCLVLAAQVVFPGDDSKARAIRFSQSAVGIAAKPSVTSPNGGETLAAGSQVPVTWSADGTTGLGFEVSLFPSAPATYNEGFESGPPLPPGFTNAGPAWTVTTGTAAAGAKSARSGVIGDDGRSELHLVVHMQNPGPMTFMRRVSSESGFDFLSFHVDGIPIGASWGLGTTFGTPAYLPLTLPPGTHELVWVYEKDVSDSAGDDAAWIDSLVVPGVETAAATVINGAVAPDGASQLWIVPNLPAANYRIRIRRLAIAPWLASDTSDGVFTIQGAAAPPAPPVPPPPAPPPAPPPSPPPPAVARCVVPKVKGKTTAQARALLRSKRCALGRVTRAYSARVKKGKVIRQSRAPGARLPRGTKVNVVVSRGRRRA